MIITGWSKVYFSSNQLLTDGIYGVVRHPQYTGIFLAIFGQLVHWPTIPTLALGPVIVLAYVHLARREERSEEHTSELQSLMRISYAVFCLKKKKIINTQKATEQNSTT